MNPYKHPAEKSILIGMWVVSLFGIYGMHRFYLEEKKAGSIILSIALCGVFGVVFKFKYFEVIIALSGIVFLFELLTFHPRIIKYNKNLTKHFS